MFLIFFACLLAFANCQLHESLVDGPALYQLTNVTLNLGESPLWDPRKNLLFFVDCFGSRVYSFNPSTKAVNSIPVPGMTSTPIVLTENSDIVLVGVNSSVIAIEWDGTNPPKNQKVLATVGPEYELPLLTVFNDGKADKNGNLWIGTTIKNFSSENLANGAYLNNGGALYRISKDDLAHPKVELANVTLSNGMTWNLADDKFYFIDSVTNQVVQYDFDVEQGVISNPQVVFDTKDHPDLTGIPDGVTVDNDDNIWVALYGGGSIVRVNPKTKKILQRIAIPAKHVTSMSWGGPNYDILFVSSANRHLTATEKLFYPDAGDIFAITNLTTTGKQMYYANIVDSL